MINWLKSLLATEDDNDPKFVNLLRNILIVVFFILVLLAIVQSGILLGSFNSDTFTILSAIAIATGLFIYLVARKMIWPAKLFLPVIILIAITYFVSTANGLHDVAVSSFPVIIILASLLLGRRSLPFWAIATSMCIAFVGYWDMAGFTPEAIARTTGIDTILVGILITLGATGIINILLKRFEEIIKISKENEIEQVKANQALRNLQATLEQRIEDRTAQLMNRAGQLEAISNVARSTATLQNLDELLPAIAQLISNRFGFYHVGIFLIDEEREFAGLRASNSEGGKRMLEDQHKLKLDSNSIVGYSASRGEPRIALDVGTDAVFFNNPNLPETRSEMALPLRVGGIVIGVLDVQSTQPNAFTEDDVATMSILADQVAIAIQNANLYSDAQEALSESEETFARYVKQEWNTFAKQLKTMGYLFDGARTFPLVKREKAKTIAQTGHLLLEKEQGKITVPIKFRGQTIGVLDIKSKNGNRKWTQDEFTLLEAAAERAALALENARLVESSQRRAARERTIGEISTKIGALSDVDLIMQTAVEELGRKIGDATEVTLELGIEDTISQE